MASAPRLLQIWRDGGPPPGDDGPTSPPPNDFVRPVFLLALPSKPQVRRRRREDEEQGMRSRSGGGRCELEGAAPPADGRDLDAEPPPRFGARAGASGHPSRPSPRCSAGLARSRGRPHGLEARRRPCHAGARPDSTARPCSRK
jgi:hypothetical protein